MWHVLDACLVYGALNMHGMYYATHTTIYIVQMSVQCQLRARRALSIIQRCFVENQKGAIAVCMSLATAPFSFSTDHL